MAIPVYLTVKSRDGLTTLEDSYIDPSKTIEEFLALPWNTYGITEVSQTIGGTPLSHSSTISSIIGSGSWFLCYDVSPEPETITGFMHNGTAYVFEAENGGVTSVNGQTGDVTIATGLQEAPNSPITGIKYVWRGSEAQYAALSQYYTDTPGDTKFETY